jgi:hypothetical protein
VSDSGSLTTARDMVAAELLKLRKRRGLFWWSLVLTVGAQLVLWTVLEIVHLVNGAHHGPPGGDDGFSGAMQLLGALGILAATLVGTTAGAGDVSAGVFRDQVSTGRSRVALFAVRVPGAVLFLLPMLVAGYAIVAAASYGLAGGLPTPSAGVAVRFGLWLRCATLLPLIMAIGFAALIRSRGIAIGVLLGWGFAIAPLVASISLLGVVREGVSAAAVDRLRPLTGSDEHLVAMSIAAAVIVIAAWAVAFLLAGAWRTSTQDA